MTPTSVDKISAASVFYQRGMAFRHQGQNQRAIDDYTKALQYRDDAQAFWRRADAVSSPRPDRPGDPGSRQGGRIGRRQRQFPRRAWPCLQQEGAVRSARSPISIKRFHCSRKMRWRSTAAAWRILRRATSIAPWRISTERWRSRPRLLNSDDGRGLALVKKGDIAGAVAEFDQGHRRGASYEKKPELPTTSSTAPKRSEAEGSG